MKCESMQTLRRIEIIGEATKRLSKEFREQNCHIPWKKMIGMRNMVIHEYDKVALDVVWDVVKNNIPELLEKIAPLIPHESD